MNQVVVDKTITVTLTMDEATAPDEIRTAQISRRQVVPGEVDSLARPLFLTRNPRYRFHFSAFRNT